MSGDIVIEPGESHPDVQGIPIERMTAEQLHKFAKYYNWDGGCEPLFEVIRHPKCDLGTALLIYWLADPHFYCAYADRSEADEWMRDVYDLLTEVENNVEDGVYRRRRMPFNPRRYEGTDWTVDTDPKTPKKVEIPECMYTAVKRRTRSASQRRRKR